MEKRVYLYSRFSTPRQAAGDSVRRQKEGGEEFAKKVGLPIDSELNLNDWGLSAYTGANRKKGALGAFVSLVDEGRIAPGSFLILDSIDRLSRESQSEFLHLLTGLTRRGVQVASVADNLILNAQSEMIDFLRVQIQAERAKKESDEKGRKVAEAHGERKAEARATGTIWHRGGPFWLRFVDAEVRRDRRWEPIPERVEAVQKAFDLREAGVGTTAIAIRLNEERVASPKGRKWHHSAVLELLRNQSVLGVYQPKFARAGMRASRRPKDGDPIPNYYPPIIAEEKFHHVQALISASAPRVGRKAGPRAVTNLFQGIGRCGTCGGSVGVHASGRVYALRCSDAARGICTNRARFPYPAVEAAVLRHVVDFDLPTERSKDDVEGAALAAALGRLTDVEARIERLHDVVEAGKGDDLLKGRLDARRSERAALKAEIAVLQRAVGIGRHREPPDARRAQVSALMNEMASKEGDELYLTRSRLSAALKEVVTCIGFHAPKIVEALVGADERVVRKEVPATFRVEVLDGLSTYMFVMNPDRSFRMSLASPVAAHLLESPRYRSRFGLDDARKLTKAQAALRNVTTDS